MAADGIVLTSTISATSVDEHEGAVGADTAEAQAADTERRGRSGLNALIELRAVGHELRQLVEDALDGERARVLEPLSIDRHDRACGLEVAAHDARARYCDLFECWFLSWCLRLSLRRGSAGKQCSDRRCQHRTVE